VENALNIDTATTSVMAVYQFTDRNVIRFRYGAKSGANSSSAGVRMNSLWFRQFSLAPTMQIILPVKLLEFTATLQKSRVDLNWTTAQEKQFSHFVVQRSADGIDYSDVGLVFAEGESSDLNKYSLPDLSIAGKKGLLYYRLKMVDLDGEASFSPVRIIRIGEEKAALTVTVYPNPVKDQLRVTIPSTWQGKEVKYELFNANGQAVKIHRTTNASQTEFIQMADLGRGIYFIKASCGSESAQQRILKN
jgi:hypothetical protein